MNSRTVLAVVALLALGSPAVASATTVTEYPTCSLPPTADGALCHNGRSPNSIVAGPDGAVWFTTYGGGEVGRITVSGALTLFRVPRPAGESTDKVRGPSGITVGPDGALWYVEDFGDRIGRVATDGTFTTYDVPGARPADIALGSDGALWFTAAGTNSIGRITTAGAVTTFPLPAPGGAPIRKLGRITPGADGRLWFAEIQGRKIGAITTAGVVTEYELPAGSSTPFDVAAGPDDAVWFTLFGADRVGRITTTGKVTEHALPSGTEPGAIAAGPDGALWIGASGPSAILRLDPSDGAVTTTPLVYPAAINGMTRGPDGAMWFTETGANQIGRITTAKTISPALTPFTPAAGAVAVPAPVFAVPGTPDLGRLGVVVPMTVSGFATVDVTVVQTPVVRVRGVKARAAAVGGAKPVVVARGKVVAGSAGRRTVRVSLTRAGKRAVRHAGKKGLSVEVGLRARGEDRRKAVRQRGARLR